MGGVRDMVLRKLVIAAALAASTLGGMPEMAQAHDGGHGRHHHRGRYYAYDDGDRGYYRGYEPRRYYGRRSCRTSGTTGLILGAAGGALLGRELDRRGDRAPGTILGAAGGALVGRELGRKSRC